MCQINPHCPALQMEEETREFLRERSDRIRLLHENQAKELERFDEESVNLGFR